MEAAEPGADWRVTIMSAASAGMFSTVSRSVSPLEVLLVFMSSDMTSALSLVAAISNATRVRVLFSKNRLTTVFPRSDGVLAVFLPRIFLNAAVVLNTVWISSGESSSVEIRSLRNQGIPEVVIQRYELSMSIFVFARLMGVS